MTEGRGRYKSRRKGYIQIKLNEKQRRTAMLEELVVIDAVIAFSIIMLLGKLFRNN